MEYGKYSINLEPQWKEHNYYTSPEAKAKYRERIKAATERLEYLRDILDERLSDLKISPSKSVQEVSRPVGKTVFIVHGHDEAAKQTVARFLEKLDLKPIILHEQPNKGKTIIEKLLEHANVAAFAVVILTPDDLGSSADSPGTQRPRSRQNVVLELGLFFGAAKAREGVRTS